MSKKIPSEIVFPHKKFENLVKCLCYKNGTTLDHLCLSIQVSRPSLYAWFEGKHSPNMQYVFKMAAYFNIDPSEFFTFNMVDSLLVMKNEILEKEISSLESKKLKLEQKIQILKSKLILNKS